MNEDEILDGLTDEERAAYLEGEDETGEDTTDEEGEGAGTEGDDEAEEAGEEEGEPDVEADADPVVEVDGADAAEDEPDADESPAEREAPLYVAEAPADAEAQLTAIAEKKAALVEKFDDGELTAKEYQQQLDALGKEERGIERQLDKAEIAAEMAAQQAAKERDRSITEFLRDVNIKRDESDPAFQALDKAVKLVASMPDNASLSAREILQEAHDLAVFKKWIVAPDAKAEPSTKAEPKPAARKPIKAPPTLGRVPAADMTGTDEGNRFAHLDRMDPIAREEAVMKMSDTDRDAYLKYA